MVPQGQDVFSPTYHKAFSTPLEMTAFIAQLRELSGGKPVGFKLCIGDPREFVAIVKAMIQTGIYADFIVVDGGEGGTGAAPLEFSDSLGAPLNEGLLAVQNTLVGRRHPRPVQGRCQRQDGHGVGDGPVDGAGRGLVQLRPSLHVRGRLHPVAALPHQPLPGRSDDPGSEAATRADRAGQVRTRAQLPPQHRARPGRDDRGDGSGPHQRDPRRTTPYAGSPSSRPCPSRRSTTSWSRGSSWTAQPPHVSRGSGTRPQPSPSGRGPPPSKQPAPNGRGPDGTSSAPPSGERRRRLRWAVRRDGRAHVPVPNASGSTLGHSTRSSPTSGSRPDRRPEGHDEEARVSSCLISADLGTRPDASTFSSTTRPGVAMTP